MLSPLFWLLIAASLVVYYHASRSARLPWLLVCSLAFLAWRSPASLPAVLSVIALTWASVKAGETLQRRTWIPRLAAILLTSLLLGYKIAQAILEAAPAAPTSSSPADAFLLPLGFSYLLLRSLHVVFDSVRGKPPPDGFIAFTVYLIFFPSLPAGPIDRWERVGPQLSAAAPFTTDDLKAGARRILRGMLFKYLLAAWLLPLTRPLVSNPFLFHPWERWLAIPAYSLMIFFDFAGYSELAIGLARLYGIQLMENFHRPYLTGNISQFWREWHISLSDWLRDYLFLPLGGRWNYHAERIGLHAAAITTMILCGLWHGIAAGFLLWGLLHGSALALHQSYRAKARKLKRLRQWRRAGWYPPLCRAVTFTFVTLAWIPFACPDPQRLWRFLEALVRWA